MADNKEAELWAGWTRDAMRSFDIELGEDEDAVDTAVDDMIDISTQYADAMLDEYEERFQSSSRGKKRRKKRGGGGRRRDDDGDGE